MLDVEAANANGKPVHNLNQDKGPDERGTTIQLCPYLHWAWAQILGPRHTLEGVRSCAKVAYKQSR